ncbi:MULTISPECIES: cystatin domain-containing protein [Vibrio]|jgi:opacity protein-like surface antigen|uniref:Cystatin domain-containing protein n=1 Tax=Vibrio kanaloae TaxID=170673 RepID=A0ABV4LE41_9VIBR|nr:cystatin domain-containing protein [Vibrio kanaloae]NOI99349.1 2-oxoglutarate dehydrogenase [Vibrio kanaloae]OEF14988.1 2-oxoglutarate dehydrogenase [Vibrio kanaloae 5S-149]QPK05867.1 2-oxoglutarate dehydrogenase [Vibrio kanaloae]
MKKVLLATLFSVVALAGCSQKAEVSEQSQEEMNPICSTKNLTGGWSQSDITREAKQALDVVLGQMNTTAKLKKILGVRTQVVAGLNYAIEFEMDNGEVWNTIVYRSLQGDIEMMQAAQQGRLCS